MTNISSLAFAFAAADTTVMTGTGTYVSGRGRLVIPTVSGGGYTAYFVSAGTYDLINSQTAWQVPTMPNVGGGGTEAYFGVKTSAGELRFRWGNGSLSAQEVVSGTTTTVGSSVTYSATNHLWMQIIAAGQVVSWQVSADGITWTTLASKTTTLTLTGMTWNASSGAYQTEASGGYAEVDNLGLAPAATTTVLATGWTVGERISMMAQAVGVVTSRPYFQAADWLWNPIPTNPVLHANDNVWAGSSGYMAQGVVSCAPHDYGVGVVRPDQITSLTSPARYTMAITGSYGNPFTGKTIPIPDGQVVAPMTTTYGDKGDSHLTIADPFTNTVYSFWQATPTPNPRSATYGGIAALNGDGRETSGSSTAANISRYAGIIRITEMQAAIAAGTGLGHTLFIAIDCASANYVYPASKADPNVNPAQVAVPIPMGARMFLDRSINVETIANASQAEKVIMRTLQSHGAVVGDHGGSRFGLLFEYDPSGSSPGANWIAMGITSDYFNMTHIPRGSLHVLANSDGT